MSKLKEWLRQQIQNSDEILFLGIPDSWYDDLHFVCENLHVSKRHLKSERLCADVCLVCMEPVSFCPPITEEKLREILGEKSCG